jgi:hypothetical protein
MVQKVHVYLLLHAVIFDQQLLRAFTNLNLFGCSPIIFGLRIFCKLFKLIGSISVSLIACYLFVILHFHFKTQFVLISGFHSTKIYFIFLFTFNNSLDHLLEASLLDESI